MSIIIETKGLSKVYIQGKIEIQALKNIDLKVETKEAVAIVGKSGSGKSTLLHLLGSLDEPTGGDIRIAGTDIIKMNENDKCKFRRKTIGFVFQFFNLIPELNVKENIIFPILLSKSKADNTYIDELIHDLELENRIYHLPNQLSGGEQQRVSIARALAGKPEIVMCDEPTGNLDEETGGQVIAKLLSIYDKYNQTLLIVTHDSDIADRMSRKITLYHGEIVDDSCMRARDE